MGSDAGIVCRDCKAHWRDSPTGAHWHRVEWIAPDDAQGAVYGEYFLCHDCHVKEHPDEEHGAMPSEDAGTDESESEILVAGTDYRALALDLAVTLVCGLEKEHDAVEVTRIADVFVTWLEAGGDA